MKKYLIEGNIIVSINDKALNKIYNYAPEKYNTENGGILLGKLKKDKMEYIITDVSITNANDRKGRYFFIRNKDRAQKIVNKSWEKSGGILNYIGEWHTHRELIINPSLTDINLIKNIKKDNVGKFDYVLLIILGFEYNMFLGYIDKSNRFKFGVEV